MSDAQDQRMNEQEIAGLAVHIDGIVPGYDRSEAGMRKLAADLRLAPDEAAEWPRGADGVLRGVACTAPVGGADRPWTVHHDHRGVSVPLSRITGDARAHAEEFRRAAGAVQGVLQAPDYFGTYANGLSAGGHRAWGTPYLRWRGKHTTLELRAGRRRARTGRRLHRHVGGGLPGRHGAPPDRVHRRARRRPAAVGPGRHGGRPGRVHRVPGRAARPAPRRDPRARRPGVLGPVRCRRARRRHDRRSAHVRPPLRRPPAPRLLRARPGRRGGGGGGRGRARLEPRDPRGRRPRGLRRAVAVRRRRAGSDPGPRGRGAHRAHRQGRRGAAGARPRPGRGGAPAGAHALPLPGPAPAHGGPARPVLGRAPDGPSAGKSSRAAAVRWPRRRPRSGCRWRGWPSSTRAGP
jgi:hypothetical protein